MRATAIPLLAGLLAAGPPAAPANAAAVSAVNDPEEAIQLYEEGRQALELADFARAAERFHAAYDALPREELERRAAVLFEVIEARRAAFSEDGRPTHLCQAEALLASFLEDNRELRGSRRSRDARKAAELQEALVGELATITRDNPDFDCEEPPPDGLAEVDTPSDAEGVPSDESSDESSAGDPAPLPLRDPYVGGGVALIGAGVLLAGASAVGLAIGGQSEFEGRWLFDNHPELATTSPEAQRIELVGRRSNILAITAGITSAAALGSGIALYILGKRRQRRDLAALEFTPALAPGELGARLHLRF